jgi:diketogulonate reductase-like aldo/keto reductase
VQNEVNPFYCDEAVLKYCHEKKIAIVGYRPFGDKQGSEIFRNKTLEDVAQRVNSSVQEVILQWMNQKGVTPIPHSNTIDHIRNNLALPEWTLTGEEIEKIDSIKNGQASTCGWQKFLNKDLYNKSMQWIDALLQA